MLIYYLIYLSIITGILFRFKQRNSIGKIFYILSAILIGFTVAFRDQTLGPDTYNYLDYFIRPNNNSTYYQASEIEPGITKLNWLLRLFITDKYIYSFVLSILYQFPIFLLIYKYSYNRFLSLFLYISFSVASPLFILSFSMLRQFMALAVWAIIIIRYNSNNEKIDKTIFVLFILMVCCHSSSLIIILLYIIRKRVITKTVYYVSILASVLIGFVIHHIMPLITIFAKAIGKSFYFTTLNDSWSYSIIPTIPFVGILLSIIYISPLNICNHLYTKGLFLAVIIGNIMSFGNNIDRMCAYFYLLSILAIPYFFHIKFNKKIKFSLLISLLGYFTYKYYLVLSLCTGKSVWELVPYKSFI